MTHSLQTLLFDLDGTLTDPGEGITACIQYALTCLGRVPPPGEELEWCIGPPLLGSFAQLLVDAPAALAPEALRLYRERYTVQGIFEARLYPGVCEMLRGLRTAEFQLFVATSKPTSFARRVLEHFGLAVFFDGIYGPELDGTRNDKGELIAYLLTENGIDAATTAMIGDRMHDIIAARSNGVLPLGVAYGYGSLAELEQAGAVQILADPWAVREYCVALRSRAHR